jgi:uncharacterized membrane protein YoaK (UPF0700 family)
VTRPAQDRHVAAVAWILAGVAGYVDALGFVLLQGVFTSHATGDTAHMARGVAAGNGATVMRFAWPIAMFVAGLFVSGTITAVGKRRRFHSTFGIALGLEAALLFASPLVTGYFPLAAALAGSMGIQTLTVTMVSGLRIYTTYMTGNLAKFAEGATQFLITGKRTELRHSIVTGMLWMVFLAGAVLGTFGQQLWGREAAIAPAVVVAAIAAFDFRRPIDPAEEFQG